jgi:hypothetical protein
MFIDFMCAFCLSARLGSLSRLIRFASFRAKHSEKSDLCGSFRPPAESLKKWNKIARGMFSSRMEINKF